MPSWYVVNVIFLPLLFSKIEAYPPIELLSSFEYDSFIFSIKGFISSNLDFTLIKRLSSLLLSDLIINLLSPLAKAIILLFSNFITLLLVIINWTALLVAFSGRILYLLSSAKATLSICITFKVLLWHEESKQIDNNPKNNFVFS